MLQDDTLISLGSETEIFYLGLVATEMLRVVGFGFVVVVVVCVVFLVSVSFLICLEEDSITQMAV